MWWLESKTEAGSRSISWSHHKSLVLAAEDSWKEHKNSKIVFQYLHKVIPQIKTTTSKYPLRPESSVDDHGEGRYSQLGTIANKRLSPTLDSYDRSAITAPKQEGRRDLLFTKYELGTPWFVTKYVKNNFASPLKLVMGFVAATNENTFIEPLNPWYRRHETPAIVTVAIGEPVLEMGPAPPYAASCDR